MSKEFKDILGGLMKLRGWDSTELSYRLHGSGHRVSLATVNNWLSGYCRPKYDQIEPLAEVLGVEPNDLFAYEPVGAGE